MWVLFFFFWRGAAQFFKIPFNNCIYFQSKHDNMIQCKHIAKTIQTYSFQHEGCSNIPLNNNVDDKRKRCRGFKASDSGEKTYKIWSEMCRKIFFVYMFVVCFTERKQWKQASCSRLTICCMNSLCTIKGFEYPSHICECLLRDLQLFLFENSSWGWALSL